MRSTTTLGPAAAAAAAAATATTTAPRRSADAFQCMMDGRRLRTPPPHGAGEAVHEGDRRTPVMAPCAHSGTSLASTPQLAVSTNIYRDTTSAIPLRLSRRAVHSRHRSSHALPFSVRVVVVVRVVRRPSSAAANSSRQKVSRQKTLTQKCSTTALGDDNDDARYEEENKDKGEVRQDI